MRTTVDLSSQTHRALDREQDDAADQLGYAKVTRQDALTALAELLTYSGEDEGLREFREQLRRCWLAQIERLHAERNGPN